MSCLTVYKDNGVDATLVSNHFIDEYMKDANDAQLKVYLYLLRIMSANLSTSISDIADKFNHTEK
ncbi:MAG: DNA replication protein DnaD, partial [Lachnospiraceae bacterium]